MLDTLKIMEEKSDLFSVFEQKMRAAGMKDAPIRAFHHSYASLRAGDSGLIPENSIETIGRLPELEKIRGTSQNRPELLSRTVMIKLNGGLGTSMGLERAKSLLPRRHRAGPRRTC